MTPRQMLVWWLRVVEGALRRHIASCSACSASQAARGAAERPRPPECLSLEALMLAPTVEPDYTRHVRPDAPNYAAAAWWLQTVWPHAWGHESDLYRECVAASLLARREMVAARELMS